MANLPAGCPLEAYRKVIEPGQESGDTSMVTLAEFYLEKQQMFALNV